MNYSRDITLKVSRDTAFQKMLLERKGSSLASSMCSEHAAETGVVAASSSEVIDIGGMTTVRLLFLEFSGANLELTMTSASGTATIPLAPADGQEAILLLEAVALTGVTLVNNDATTEMTYSITLLGT